MRIEAPRVTSRMQPVNSVKEGLRHASRESSQGPAPIADLLLAGQESGSQAHVSNSYLHAARINGEDHQVEKVLLANSSKQMDIIAACDEAVVVPLPEIMQSGQKTDDVLDAGASNSCPIIDDLDEALNSVENQRDCPIPLNVVDELNQPLEQVKLRIDGKRATDTMIGETAGSPSPQHDETRQESMHMLVRGESVLRGSCSHRFQETVEEKADEAGLVRDVEIFKEHFLLNVDGEEKKADENVLSSQQESDIQ